jgi:hypothetical protein
VLALPGQVATVTGHCRTSHPRVTSLALSIGTPIPITDSGDPGKSATTPRMLNQAARRRVRLQPSDANPLFVSS